MLPFAVVIILKWEQERMLVSPIQFLFDVFNANLQKPAFIYDGIEFTYEWLVGRIEYWQSDLIKKEITAGQLVAVTGDYSPDICALAIALISARVVVVPFASVVGSEKKELTDIANVGCEFFFINGECVDFQRYSTIVSNPLLKLFLSQASPGLVVFTSGSTGFPKGILHDFSKIIEKFRVKRRGLKTLTFLQLDHLGGINTLLHTVSNGGTVISVAERSPRFICQAVEDHQIELLPVTPSFLNLLLVSREYSNYDLSSLKVVSYGTEVMPESTLVKMREVFPGVLMQQTYGLSELGVLRTKSREDGSLWVKVGGEGFETKIVDNTLWIRAHSAMVGYLNAPQPFDSEGWFNTDDQVETDGDFIKIIGRKSDMINVGGQKVFPSEVESILIQMSNVKDAVVMGEKHMLMGNIVIAKLVLEHPEDPDALKTRVRTFCRERLSTYKVPMKIEIVTEQLYNARFKRVRVPLGQARN